MKNTLKLVTMMWLVGLAVLLASAPFGWLGSALGPDSAIEIRLAIYLVAYPITLGAVTYYLWGLVKKGEGYDD